MSIGRVLRMAREMKGETLRSLEAKTGLSNALISQIESGKVKSPSFESIVRLSRALNLPLKHFEEQVLDFRDTLRKVKP